MEDPELALLAKGLEKKSTLGSSLVRNASSRIRQVSQELKRLVSLNKRPIPTGRFDRNSSAAAHALKGLKFISKTDGGAGWAAVEKRFDEITSSPTGLLVKFENLKEFWDQIADQSFDTGFRPSLDMVDKEVDGRITEEEVREIIGLSASANRLSTIQKQADEYAAMIMEELDPNNLGYIMIENLEMLIASSKSNGAERSESRNLESDAKVLLRHSSSTWLSFYSQCAETPLPGCNKTRLGVVVPFDDNLNFHSKLITFIPFDVKTWMYLTVPLVLYAGERLLRAFRSSIKAVKILKVAISRKC
ncbi:hypothetical protein HAX54_038352 [Datura stramonium]|uniref:NADPH oxidase Respiratory burst domain-containing protein n=1 Tax=Datura stramonium TaxID=4076 RepID=A0ABS8SI94_DATST|nr:hypothetical protein [Datura stramonium]